VSLRSVSADGIHRPTEPRIGLVNVVNLKAGGLGTLGTKQLEWLEKDVSQIVVG
jgi:hypothetical protein